MFGLGPGPNPTVPTPKLRLLGFGRYGPKPMGPQAQTAWPNWIHLKPLTPTLRQTFRWLSACHKSASKELGALSHQLHRYFLSEINIQDSPLYLRHILRNKVTIHQRRIAHFLNIQPPTKNRSVVVMKEYQAVSKQTCDRKAAAKSSSCCPPSADRKKRPSGERENILAIFE